MDNTNARRHMETAVSEMWKSPDKGVRVGVVIARDSKVLVSVHKGLEGSTHAEAIALQEAAHKKFDVRGAAVFVTLEPCANLENAKVPCSQRLIDAGIAEVWIGCYDTNPRIYRMGWSVMRDAGIDLKDFHEDLRTICEEGNAQFREHFTKRTGRSGRAKFDFLQNGGMCALQLNVEPTSPVWETRWTPRGKDTMYAYGGTQGIVAHARYAHEFSEIDDPDALDWSNHSPPIAVNDIAVFRNTHGHALCKLALVEPTRDFGGNGHTSMTFDYELRPFR